MKQKINSQNQESKTILSRYEHIRLRAQVQKIEHKILAITGDNVEYNMEWTRSQRKCEQVERLIWKRKHLLVMALQAYICAYLKTHFPEEYTRAALYVAAGDEL